MARFLARFFVAFYFLFFRIHTVNVRVRRLRNGAVWQGWFFLNNVCYWEKLTPVEGRLPDLIMPQGDELFQASKAKALKLLEERKKMIENMASKDEYNKLQAQVAIGLLKKKYGVSLEGCSLRSLEGKVETLIKNKCGPEHLKNVLTIVRQFVQYVSSAKTLEAVTEKQIQSYLDAVDARHPANRTYNEHIRQLKRIFREFCSFGSVKDFVAKLSKRVENDAQPREIFTSEEIEQILDLSKEVDPLIYSMAVIASCTGLRLKDICLLKWESVNFRRNLITLTTHKTGGDVILGMWPLLQEELNRLQGLAKKKDIYVLPDAAKIYMTNADHLIDRLRKILYALRYGKNEIMLPARQKRIHSASLRGWHSFRGSFVVAALRSGVSIEVLQKVLGAKTVEVLYRHYIHIDDQFMQNSFTNKAPDFAKKERT